MESLLLQETGGGYFTLENDTGRILLEISGPPSTGGSHGAGRIIEVDTRELILRNDDEIAALIAALL